MSLQDSPSLEDFQAGLQAGSQRQHNPSGARIAIYLLLAAITGLFLVTFVTSRNQSPRRGTASITGKVVDEFQQPVPAEVMVLGTELRTNANAAGEFTLTGLPPGNVMLLVGYGEMAFQFPYQLQAGETFDVGIIQYTTTQIPLD